MFRAICKVVAVIGIVIVGLAIINGDFDLYQHGIISVFTVALGVL